MRVLKSRADRPKALTLGAKHPSRRWRTAFERLEDRAAPGGGVAGIMASGGLFWLFDDSLSASTDEDDDPLPADSYSGLDFRFTVDILSRSGHESAWSGGSSLSEPGPLAGGVGANIPLAREAAQAESQSPSGVSLQVFREAASERIESVVERLFADKLGGLDLGPLIRNLSAVDDLARAMASGTPAVIRASAAPTMSSGSPSSSPAASGQVGSGPATGAAATGFSTRNPGPGGSEPTASDFFYDNMPPEVADESYGIPHDQGFGESAPGVLSNDYDPDMWPGDLYAVLDQGPSHAATFDLQSDGSFTYTPQPGYLGDDSFTYWVSDGMDYSLQTATCFLGVYNTPPVAEPDGGASPYLTLHDTPLEIFEAEGVLANDYDFEGDPLQAVLKTAPGHAKTFTLNADGSLYY
ncbi:MAG: Ig-like domain-containing protein, partial [Planctomycetota bacterium]